jgi:hypothetical protein
MFPGPFDLLLNFYFRCRHRCTLSLGFLQILSVSADRTMDRHGRAGQPHRRC